MFLAHFWRSICKMIPIIRECTEFIAVVLTSNCQNGERDFLELLARWQHRVVVRVGHWVFKDALEIDGRISDERIEQFKSSVLVVSIKKFCAPEFLITKEIVL